MKGFAGFVAGILVGGAGVALWTHFYTTTEPQPVSVASGDYPSISGTGLLVDAPAPVQTTDCAVSPVSTQKEADLPQPKALDPLPAGVPPRTYSELLSTLTPELKQRAETMSEREGQAMCAYLAEQRARREEARFTNEPRDDAWAYPMEQLIAQHIHKGMKGQPLELKVECRTTYCDIRAEGSAQVLEMQRAFDAARASLTQQDWNDLMPRASGGGSDGVRWHSHARLVRGDPAAVRAMREMRAREESNGGQ